MGDKSVLIIDEDYEKLHHTAIDLVGNQFRLVVADNIAQVLDYFRLRDIPRIVFLSDTIKNRMRLVRVLRNHNKPDLIIPICKAENRMRKQEPCVIKPYCAQDFLDIINNLDWD